MSTVPNPDGPELAAQRTAAAAVHADFHAALTDFQLGGLGICAAAAVSIACGLVYLRSAPRSCPGCVGRGTGEVCCLCGLPVPIALRRSPGDAPEYDPGCHGCASGLRHTHATVTR